MFKALLYSGTLALLAPLPAQAATLLESYNFSVSGGTGPIASQSGSFQVVYDDVADTRSLLSVTFSIEGTSFNLANTGLQYPFGANRLLIGGISNGLASSSSNTPDFGLAFNVLTLGSAAFVYSTSTTPNGATGSGVVVTRTTTPFSAAVPEPSTWAMMLIGFGAIGASMRHRRSGVASPQKS